jgi:hypothetical protein
VYTRRLYISIKSLRHIVSKFNVHKYFEVKHVVFVSVNLRPHRTLRTLRTLRTELCVASHIVNTKRKYFSVRIASIPYVAYIALCVASHIVNKRRYFSVRIANIAYVALCVASYIVNKRRYFSVRIVNLPYVALCVAAA